MRLPEEFVEYMDQCFQRNGVERAGFYESFDADSFKGIRLNRSKVESSAYAGVLTSLNEKIDKVPWCDSGFYTENESSGNDPYYHAGVYYPQDPSAMLPAQVMGVKRGDKVLDLCAAPGGKATRLGEDLQGEGLLIANEINENRAKALLRNVERMGLTNTVILNETPERLADRFKGFFDKILLDVPCSGEGMFRKDPNAVRSWERFGPDTCIPLQNLILECADAMLRPGGELVYSTCTFGEREDEERIIEFMERHRDYEVIFHPEIEGVTHGGSNHILPGSMRIWPHLSRGEGHFCVHLKKSEQAETETYKPEKLPSYRMKRDDNYGFGKSRDAFVSFMKEITTEKPDLSGFNMNKENIHLMPIDPRYLSGLKVVKFGLFPGSIKATTTERLFIPSHSLALTLKRELIREDSLLSLTREDPRLTRYLKGETITADQGLKKKGYILIGVDGFPVGFGKVSTDGSVKNLYPKAWRLI